MRKAGDVTFAQVRSFSHADATRAVQINALVLYH